MCGEWKEKVVMRGDKRHVRRNEGEVRKSVCRLPTGVFSKTIAQTMIQ